MGTDATVTLTLTTFVEFASLGGSQRALRQEVETRSIDQLEVPSWAVSIQFYDVVAGEIDFGDVIVDVNEVIRRSPTYFVGCSLMSLDEIRRLPEGEDVASQLERLDTEMFVLSDNGAFAPFNDNDELLDRRDLH